MSFNELQSIQGIRLLEYQHHHYSIKLEPFLRMMVKGMQLLEWKQWCSRNPLPQKRLHMLFMFHDRKPTSVPNFLVYDSYTPCFFSCKAACNLIGYHEHAPYLCSTLASPCSEGNEPGSLERICKCTWFTCCWEISSYTAWSMTWPMAWHGFNQ